MNLNNVIPTYSDQEHAFVLFFLLDAQNFGHRVVHQEVLDAIVMYLHHEGIEGAIKINSHGKNYILRMTECKQLKKQANELTTLNITLKKVIP